MKNKKNSRYMKYRLFNIHSCIVRELNAGVKFPWHIDTPSYIMREHSLRKLHHLHSRYALTYNEGTETILKFQITFMIHPHL